MTVELTLVCDGCGKREQVVHLLGRVLAPKGWLTDKINGESIDVCSTECGGIVERKLRGSPTRARCEGGPCVQFLPSGKPDVCAACARPYLAHPGTSRDDR